MKYDELRALRDAAPEDAEIEVFYPGDRDSWAQTASGVSAFYTAAYTAIPALLDEVARLRAALEIISDYVTDDPDEGMALLEDAVRTARRSLHTGGGQSMRGMTDGRE